KAKITGLTANKDYVVRSVVGENVSEEMPFTTERVEQIPYSNFDQWFKDGKTWYLGDEDKNRIWDSGNKGANTASENNPTAPDYTNKVDLPGNEAAGYLETKAVLGIMAAGNLYTGSYGQTMGTSGAKLNFGIPYTSRPTVLKGYYKYQPKPIDKTKSPYDNLKGKTDSCYIYVALFDWETPYEVDNSQKPPKLVDLSKALGLGELKTDRHMDDFESFEIKIKYRDLTKRPTYILIVASASKYGDYFTGGVGSRLWVDEFELGFD
ncbi:MAG: PCMD domain-containing protein, partial [Odoribacter sp.]|nr:PCMD domain-containing protein [Odoribacter sp.]